MLIHEMLLKSALWCVALPLLILWTALSTMITSLVNHKAAKFINEAIDKWIRHKPTGTTRQELTERWESLKETAGRSAHHRMPQMVLFYDRELKPVQVARIEPMMILMKNFGPLIVFIRFILWAHQSRHSMVTVLKDECAVMDAAQTSGGNVRPDPSVTRASVTSLRSSVNLTETVFNGNRANIEDHGWVVAIGVQSWPGYYLFDRKPNQIPPTHCTGSILASDAVLTAGQCTLSPWSTIWVTAGTDCRPERGGVLKSGTQVRRVAVFKRHPQASSTAWNTEMIIQWLTGVPFYPFYRVPRDTQAGSDITILLLDKPFNMVPPVKRIQLATASQNPENTKGTPLITSVGWGLTGIEAKFGSAPLRLGTVTFPQNDNLRRSQDPIYRQKTHTGSKRYYQLVNAKICGSFRTVKTPLVCAVTGPGLPQDCEGDSGNGWVWQNPSQSDKSAPLLIGVKSKNSWHSTGYDTMPSNYDPMVWRCGQSNLMMAVRVNQNLKWIRQYVPTV